MLKGNGFKKILHANFPNSFQKVTDIMNQVFLQ